VLSTLITTTMLICFLFLFFHRFYLLTCHLTN